MFVASIVAAAFGMAHINGTDVDASDSVLSGGRRALRFSIGFASGSGRGRSSGVAISVGGGRSADVEEGVAACPSGYSFDGSRCVLGGVRKLHGHLRRLQYGGGGDDSMFGSMMGRGGGRGGMGRANSCPTGQTFVNGMCRSTMRGGGRQLQYYGGDDTTRAPPTCPAGTFYNGIFCQPSAGTTTTTESTEGTGGNRQLQYGSSGYGGGSSEAVYVCPEGMVFDGVVCQPENDDTADGGTRRRQLQYGSRESGSSSATFPAAQVTRTCPAGTFDNGIFCQPSLDTTSSGEEDNGGTRRLQSAPSVCPPGLVVTDSGCVSATAQRSPTQAERRNEGGGFFSSSFISSGGGELGTISQSQADGNLGGY
ncbi:unnamed protein product [Vitrella brassicaformis CCMP3155]|uniref:Uncharacterized protein n=1 Tax=Vitrella brassicaformis (strain CCMP3155) TaxID=1169540 RepID=A0A0G4EAB1_VITBC|nr:unnamed protein product [Vitrella brassicaformis CCMP3155]|eukprot:CEL92168.1 unnamed protein product [Vitrella brassicaformis CCMP3155]